MTGTTLPPSTSVEVQSGISPLDQIVSESVSSSEFSGVKRYMLGILTIIYGLLTEQEADDQLSEEIIEAKYSSDPEYITAGQILIAGGYLRDRDDLFFTAPYEKVVDFLETKYDGCGFRGVLFKEGRVTEEVRTHLRNFRVEDVDAMLLEADL